VYTRPAEFKGWAVPDVLLSGNHESIEEWRAAQRVQRTRDRRPDLLPDGDNPES
jgi:tRNA (guanine37-N1)-methyltransferase